jgi:hypothetical protein
MSSMQIHVPHSEYGECDYFMPYILQYWLVGIGLRGKYCGSRSGGSGYTNGISNVEYTYMVYNVQKEDATAFKIMFPECKIHISER